MTYLLLFLTYLSCTALADSAARRARSVAGLQERQACPLLTEVPCGSICCDLAQGYFCSGPAGGYTCCYGSACDAYNVYTTSDYNYYTTSDYNYYYTTPYNYYTTTTSGVYYPDPTPDHHTFHISNSSKAPKGKIIGAAIGAVVAVAAIVSGFIAWLRRRRQRNIPPVQPQAQGGYVETTTVYPK